MELLNTVQKLDAKDGQALAVEHEALEAVVLILSPIVPHIAESLWQALGHNDVVNAAWPSADESALVRASLELVIQINGKVRGKIEVAVDADNDTIQQAALACDDIQRFLTTPPKKVIVVKAKLVSIVV